MATLSVEFKGHRVRYGLPLKIKSYLVALCRVLGSLSLSMNVYILCLVHLSAPLFCLFTNQGAFTL